jgi:hypothetical protein
MCTVEDVFKAIHLEIKLPVDPVVEVNNILMGMFDQCSSEFFQYFLLLA